MDYVKFGNTGLYVSRICLGYMSFGEVVPGWHSWVLNEENSRPIIRRALELGINFFDTANVYAGGTSEEITGRILKEYANRDEIVLATKVWGRMHPGPNGAGLSRKAILSEIDKSLKRLGTDYVDLYIIHRWDYDTPIDSKIQVRSDRRSRSLYHRASGGSSEGAWRSPGIYRVGLAAAEGTGCRTYNWSNENFTA